MNNNFVVKQATIEDLEELVVLFNQYRVFYNQASDLDGAKVFLFKHFVHGESVIFVVSDVEISKVIGFVQLYPSFSSISMKRSLILNDLYVDEDYRRRGVAQLLLESAKKYAKQVKVKGLELSTAIDSERAKRIYERNGYKQDKDFVHYYLNL